MSIKKIERLAMMLVLVLAFTALPAAAQMKLAYVDTQYLLAKYQHSLDVQKQLEGEGQAMAAELKKMEDEIVTRQQDLEQKSLMLTEEKKREQAGQLQAMYQQYQQQSQQKQQQLVARREELLAPVFEEIDSAIKVVGEREGYDFVLKAEALLYAKDAHNLTEQVLEDLAKKVTTK